MSEGSNFFDAFSLSMTDLGKIPDIRTLFVCFLQVIVKLQIPIVIFSCVYSL